MYKLKKLFKQYIFSFEVISKSRFNLWIQEYLLQTQTVFFLSIKNELLYFDINFHILI